MDLRPLADIFEHLRRGDRPALERLIVAYEPYLRTVIRRQLSDRLRSKFDSADVVQSVWVHFLNRLRDAGEEFETPAHLHAFLVRLARHGLINRLRHFHTALEWEQPLANTPAEGVPPSPQPRPSEVAQAGDLWDRLLALCPPAHHEILRLKRQGLPLADIAARTGVHPDSVRRILRTLARQLASQTPLVAPSNPDV
jgi:RNA polymerase sigma-70 factor (ECF subfamily)